MEDSQIGISVIGLTVVVAPLLQYSARWRSLPPTGISMDSSNLSISGWVIGERLKLHPRRQPCLGQEGPPGAGEVHPVTLLAWPLSPLQQMDAGTLHYTPAFVEIHGQTHDSPGDRAIRCAREAREVFVCEPSRVGSNAQEDF